MDRSQLSSLKRSQLQQLARRESLKANLKNVEIVRLLLEKYPDGVPELTDKPSTSKRPRSSPSNAKQPARRSKRKATAKSEPVSVKAEESHPNVHAEPTTNEPEDPHKGRDVRSMAPPPVTPTAPFHPLLSPVNRRLPTTPRIDVVVETEPEGDAGSVVDVHDAVHPPETTPTPPEAAAATSHQVHQLLRGLRSIVAATPLDPEDPSSILHRARTLSAILDTTILPRMMKVDKDIKDVLWMRVAVESKLGPLLEEEGVLPEYGHGEIPNTRPDPSFPAVRQPSPKRVREEEDDGGVAPLPQSRTSKRTRVR